MNTPLSHIISKFIPLRKRRNVFIGRCPKCEIKSLFVSDSTNLFWCYSCLVGGNAIIFIMIVHQVDFAHAVKNFQVNGN